MILNFFLKQNKNLTDLNLFKRYFNTINDKDLV